MRVTWDIVYGVLYNGVLRKKYIGQFIRYEIVV
jgi:hypothetical protein